MADNRNTSFIRYLESLDTDQLVALDGTIHQLLNYRTQAKNALTYLPKLSLLAAPRDVYLPSKEDKEKAATLLAHVDHADYIDIERMWKENPQLMFVKVKDKDGNTTTPYQRALFNLDTYTWKPFEKWIQENRPELVREYQKQKEEQTEHFNLQPASDAYKTYDIQTQKWINDKISNKEIDKEWLKLGNVLKKTLPRHMLREFCRENDSSWTKTSTFDADALPAPEGGRIYDWSTRAYINLDSVEFDTNFGSSYSLLRGRGGRAAAVGGDGLGWGACWILFDAGVFRQLYEIRTSDLTNSMSLDHREAMRAPTCGCWVCPC